MSNLALNLINKFEIKTSRKGAARTGEGFTLLILNEDMSNIDKIIKKLEYSYINIWSHWNTKTLN